MSDACPICLATVPLNWAVPWDNGEPAPDSKSGGFMSVCATCAAGVDGKITPWRWVTACIEFERRNDHALRAEVAKLTAAIKDLEARVR